MIRDASAALRRGDAKAALARLAMHEKRFGASLQGDLRTALRIEALCRLDRASQARREAKALLAARPGTPVSDRISRSCAGKP